jgi:hypothetical protein
MALVQVQRRIVDGCLLPFLEQCQKIRPTVSAPDRSPQSRGVGGNGAAARDRALAGTATRWSCFHRSATLELVFQIFQQQVLFLPFHLKMICSQLQPVDLSDCKFTTMLLSRFEPFQVFKKIEPFRVILGVSFSMCTRAAGLLLLLVQFFQKSALASLTRQLKVESRLLLGACLITMNHRTTCTNASNIARADSLQCKFTTMLLSHFEPFQVFKKN